MRQTKEGTLEPQSPSPSVINMSFFCVTATLEQLDMLITLGEGDKALIKSAFQNYIMESTRNTLGVLYPIVHNAHLNNNPGLGSGTPQTTAAHTRLLEISPQDYMN